MYVCVRIYISEIFKLCEFIYFTKINICYSLAIFSDRMLMLQYSKHGECILQEIGAAFRGEHPSDLLIVCDGKETLRAHKLVLAAASPLIRYNFNFSKNKGRKHFQKKNCLVFMDISKLCVYYILKQNATRRDSDGRRYYNGSFSGH